MNSSNTLLYKSEFTNEAISDAINSFINKNLLVNESDILLFENYIYDLQLNPLSFFKHIPVSFKDRLYQESFTAQIENCYLQYKLLIFLILKLKNDLDLNTAVFTSKLTEIENIYNQINQKNSIINLYNNIYKLVYSEGFFNKSNINNSYKATINNNGQLLLPIQNKSLISNNYNFSIGSNSIGRAGSLQDLNESSDVNDINKKLFIWSSDVPSSLELVVNFNTVQLINCITLSNYEVNNVNTCNLISIKDDSNHELLAQSVTINTLEKEIYFYPTQTQKLFITIHQSQYDGREYIIAPNICTFSLLTFVPQGYVESTHIGLDITNLLSVKSFISLNNLVDNNLFNYDYSYSVNNGLSYFKENTINTLNDINSILWKLNFSINTDLFSKISSLFPLDVKNNLKTQIAFLYQNQKPFSISLKDKIVPNHFSVINTNLFKKGNNNLFSLPIYTASQIQIPLGIKIDPELASDLIVKVNGETWSYVNNITDAAADDKVFSLDKNNYQNLVFGNDTEGVALTNSAKVEVGLPDESLSFVYKDNSYVAYTDEYIDPDKELITITYVNPTTYNGKYILTPGKSIYKLPHQNIVNGSLIFTSKSLNGGVYSGTSLTTTEVDFSNGNYNLASTQYTVDYKNGYIYFYEVVKNNHILTVKYSFYLTQTLEVEDYNIVYENYIPVGISIAADKFPSLEIEDQVNHPVQRLLPDGARTLSLTTSLTTEDHAFFLTYKNPIQHTFNMSNFFLDEETVAQEIDFIDGHSEFYGLIKVNYEKTINYNGSGIKSFLLNHNTYYYQPLGVSFDDNSIFINEVFVPLTSGNNVGDWYISSGGEIQVKVGSAGLPAGINISYFYKSKDFDPTNKFSVDYSRGIVYSISEQKEDASITYKTSNIYIAYTVCKPIKNILFNGTDNNISVNIDTQNNYSNIMKVIYEPIDTNNIAALSKYFSPIFNNINFLFS